MLQFLPLCCHSVSDQKVDYEHIVVDGGSTDGTVDWIRKDSGVVSLSEKDDGMYDAINKGLRISTGEIVSYLNCDEQYLPGVLQRVAEIFAHNSKIDLLFGNTLLIRPDGKLLAYRKSFVPRWPYIWGSDLYLQSSSMFVRRRVFESGIMFDESWKAIGDADFVVRALRKGFSACHVNEYFSAFMITGTNLGAGKRADMELKAFRKRAPVWLRYSTFIIKMLVRFEKFWHSAYWESMPLAYSIYTIDNSSVRSEFVAGSASSFYPKGKK